jgi:hypothetical protein
MANITVSVPDGMKQEMEEFKVINWSEVARQAIAERLRRLELLRKLDSELAGSRLTEEEALELGRKMKEGMWKRYKERGW